MNGKIIDLSKHLSAEALRRLEKRNMKLPDVYNIRLVSNTDEEGNPVLEYWVSNKKMVETAVGREVNIENLLIMIVDMCDRNKDMIVPMFKYLIFVLLDMAEENPALVSEVYEFIENYLGE